MAPGRPEDLAAPLECAWICLGYSSKRGPHPGRCRSTKRSRSDGCPQGPPCYQWLAPLERRRRAIRVRRLRARPGPPRAHPGVRSRLRPGPQVFDLLVYLVRNREHVVSKDDVLDAVWSGRIVSESTLTSHVNAVRKAVGDSGGEQRLIRTIARKGFRFVGDVSEVPSPDGPGSPKAAPSNDAPAPALALPDRPSIAALAFHNLSGDPEQEYFADGVVEDIITALSRIRWLFVIARNSSFTYKGRAVDVKQIGRELGVRYVLEGSVRKAANRVRITGQLDRRHHRRASVGGAFRRHPRRHLRAAGSDRHQRRRRDRAAAGARGDRARASASRPQISAPTTIICAAWRSCIREPGRPSTRRCRCSIRRYSSIRNLRRPTRWRRGAMSGARSMAG